MSFNPGGGGGISNASDVALSNPANDQALAYSSTNQKWINKNLTGTASDATSSAKGVVQLTGDLGGTAASPTVPGLSERLRQTGSFLAATPYAVNDVVSSNNALYRCMTAHTSGAGAPNTDGDPTYWERIATITTTGLVWSASSVTTGRLAIERLPAGTMVGTTNAAARPTSDPSIIVAFITATDPSSVWLGNDIWLRTP